MIESLALPLSALEAMSDSAWDSSPAPGIAALWTEPEPWLHNDWLSVLGDTCHPDGPGYEPEAWGEEHPDGSQADSAAGSDVWNGDPTGLLVQLLFLPVSTARQDTIHRLLTTECISSEGLVQTMAGLCDDMHMCEYNRDLEKVLSYDMKRTILAQITFDIHRDRARWLVIFVDFATLPSSAYATTRQFQSTLHRLRCLPFSDIKRLRFVSLFPLSYDCSAEHLERCYEHATTDEDRATVIALMLLHWSTPRSLDDIARVLHGPMLRRVQRILGMPYVGATLLMDQLRSTW